MAAKTLRVSVTFIADEEDRRFIACHYGRHNRLATAEEVRSYFRIWGTDAGGDGEHFRRHERCGQCFPGQREDLTND